ncbi:MAG: hypothetical protein KC474_10555 [Cyanobacteria bacterium HKST-UBA04]|nr:hypothetical protein [Cyanobacteria bacterium HKST-UBA04]MCA9842836.1 hypothetical protein [Cyanobacteria bacterium HKST-UBA03]
MPLPPSVQTRSQKPLHWVTVIGLLGLLAVINTPITQAAPVHLNPLKLSQPTGTTVEAVMLDGWARSWSASLKPFTKQLLETQLKHFAQPFLTKPLDTPASPAQRWGSRSHHLNQDDSFHEGFTPAPASPAPQATPHKASPAATQPTDDWLPAPSSAKL